MSGCHVSTLFVLLVILVNGEEDLSTTNEKKFNVILFLAKTSTDESYTQDTGIKYLKFIEKTRVKHCAPSTSNEDSLSSYTSLGSDCKQLLKTGIYALIGYCRNVMGMTTAIASIENDTFSNGLRFKKSSSEDLEIRYHNPKSLKRRTNFANLIRTKQRFITQPEHTEVFKIRSKRQNVEEVPNFDNKDENQKWDIFGIMANIKLTFFGKLFEGNKNGENGVPKPPQNEMISQLGKVAENSLFDLVKETLLSVQESGDKGFLMIILGGCLKEVCDIYSTLMQSVKHVVENTDETNTLIVVTGSCPLVENGDESQNLIPVYVRGPPGANNIIISGQLYDVPYAIKNFLASINGGVFENVKSKRNKRHVDDKRNGTNHGTTLLDVLLLLCMLMLVFE